MKIESSENQSQFIRSRFESLIENRLDCIIIISATREITYVSQTVVNTLGYSSEEVMEMDNILDIIHPDDIKENEIAIKKAIQHPGIPIPGELFRVKHKNKSWRWVEVVVTNMLEDPSVNGIVHDFRDITDRVIKEKLANKYRKRLEFAAKGAKIGIWEYDLQTNRLIWDDMMFELFGIKKKDFIGTAEFSFNLIHPDDRETAKEEMKAAIIGTAKFDTDFRIIKPNGSLRHLRAIAHLQKDAQGNPISVIGTNWDITKYWKANKKFKDLLESAPDAIVIVNAQGKIELINKQTEKLFGYSQKELLGQAVEILIPNRYLGNHDAHRNGFFAKPRTLLTKQGQDLHGKTKDGLEIPIQISLSPLETEEGLLVSAAIRDITDAKLAEAELLRKNQLLSFAEEITMMGNWQWNILTNVVKCSSNLYHIFGAEPDIPLTYNSYFSFVHPDDKEKVQKYVQEAYESKKYPKLMHRIKLNDGKVKTIQLLIEPIKDNTGNIIEIVGTCQDVTEQKMAENKFRGLLESAPDAIVIVNSKGKIQLINKQTEKLFGYSAEELFDQPVEVLIPERYLGHHHAHRNGFFANPRMLMTKQGQNLHGKAKNGHEMPIQISLSPLQTEEGLLVSAAIRDITEEKLAEAELLRKNQLLNFAEEIIMMGNWQWNAQTDVWKWSRNLYHIFGADKDIKLTNATYLNFTHPDDKEKVKKYLQQALKNKTSIDLVHRIKLDNGTIKIVQLLAEVNLDNLGNIIEMVGTCQDVTEQRMAENRFRGLLESAPDAMIIINENNTIELINSETEKMFGYSKLELIGQSADILLPNIVRDIPSIKKGGQSDLFAMKKNGTNFPIEINIGKLETDNERLISVAVRDITVRKKTEAMLRKMAALEAKNEEMEELAYITSHDLREPLLTTKKYSEVLHKMFYETLGDNGRKILNTIIRSTDRMESKINHLLDYSQLGRVRNLEIVDCNKIIEIVIEDLNSLIESNNAQVLVENLPSKMKAYPTELQLIFQNLINNAIKFKVKDRNPIVRISSSKISEGWKFEVSDNGIGINKKDYKKIFSIFQRLHQASEYEGSGIGLAQVKKLVELHNGQIRVKSKKEKGTTFLFSINTKNI